MDAIIATDERFVSDKARPPPLHRAERKNQGAGKNDGRAVGIKCDHQLPNTECSDQFVPKSQPRTSLCSRRLVRSLA